MGGVGADREMRERTASVIEKIAVQEAHVIEDCEQPAVYPCLVEGGCRYHRFWWGMAAERQELERRKKAGDDEAPPAYWPGVLLDLPDLFCKEIRRECERRLALERARGHERRLGSDAWRQRPCGRWTRHWCAYPCRADHRLFNDRALASFGRLFGVVDQRARWRDGARKSETSARASDQTGIGFAPSAVRADRSGRREETGRQLRESSDAVSSGVQAPVDLGPRRLLRGLRFVWCLIVMAASVSQRGILLRQALVGEPWAMFALCLLAGDVHCDRIWSCRCTSAISMALACANTSPRLALLGSVLTVLAPLFPPKKHSTDYLREWREFIDRYGNVPSETKGGAGYELAKTSW